MQPQKLSLQIIPEPGRNGAGLPTPRLLAENWGADELAATLDSVATGFWAVDLEGRCVFVNQAACRIFGYSREECLGRKLHSLIHGSHAEGWGVSEQECRIVKALESGSAVQVEHDAFRRRDGSSFTAQYSVQPLVVHGCTRGAVISFTDTTAQKCAEKALRKSNEWLEFAQRSAGVGLFHIDFNTGETTVSDGQFRIYGLDPAGEWLSHNEWLERVHPEDREPMRQATEVAMAGGQNSGKEYRIIRPDGSIHWLFARLNVLFDEDGKATHLIGANIDVTDRVQAEKALQQFFSAAPSSMTILGFDGRVHQANPAWKSVLGFTAAELEGLLVLDLVHPADRATAEAELRTLLVSGQLTGFECRVRRQDGSYRWLLMNANVQKDAQLIYLTAQDITRRKEAEEALLLSEARFRSAFDNTLFGMAISNLDGRFVQVNDRFCKLTGFSEQELLQMDASKVTHPEDLQKSMEFLLGLENGLTSGGTITKRYLRKDGGFVWASAHVALERDRQGKPLHFIALIEDHIERERAQQEARRSDESLQFTLNSAGLGLCRLDKGEIKATEQQFRLYGLEPAEKWISRERWLQSIHPEDRVRVETEQRLAMEQGKPHNSRFRVVWPDGSVHWLECRGKVLYEESVAREIEITVDVTERRRSEAILDAFFRLSRSPKSIVGFDGSIKRANPALLEASGLTMEEFVQHPVTEFFHPDDREAMQREFQKLAAQGGHTEFECRGLRKDGSFAWLLFSATAAPDEKLIFTIANDITERKRIEAELQFRNVLLSSQLEASIDGILVVDEKGCVISHNHRFVEMWGIPPKLIEDGIDGALLQFVRAQMADPQLFLRKVEYLYAHMQESRDELMLADGRVFDRYSAPMLGPGERYYGRIWYFRDISARKRAENELRDRESALSESQRIAHIGSWRWKLPMDRSACAAWTPETYRIFGVSPDTFVPSVAAFQSLIHPGDRSAMQAWIGACLAGEEPPDLEFRVDLPDGSVRHVLSRGFLVRGAENKPIGLSGIAQDITERKLMEEAIRAHSEKLARSNEELERFAYVASHDLQEPLRMVASFTQLLSQKYSGKLDEAADRYILYAVDGAKRMQQLITDLLAYSRVNSKELDLRQTDCATVVRGAMRNLQVAIEESGASIEFDPLPALWVDQGQFTQLFQNLLGNSIKFRRKEECPRIHISAADGGAEWMISVQDNGIGIDPRQAERVFQIFQRLHTRQEYTGTGIGLAVCKKVVERHGGNLWVESEPGAGSTFRFTIRKINEDKRKTKEREG